MLTSLVTTHADPIFWAGVGLEAIGQLWLLFASYSCDVSLARWTLIFPPIALLLAFRYPDECLRPVLFCIIAAVMIGVGSAYPPQPATPATSPLVPDIMNN